MEYTKKELNMIQSAMEYINYQHMLYYCSNIDKKTLDSRIPNPQNDKIFYKIKFDKNNLYGDKYKIGFQDLFLVGNPIEILVYGRKLSLANSINMKLQEIKKDKLNDYEKRQFVKLEDLIQDNFEYEKVSDFFKDPSMFAKFYFNSFIKDKKLERIEMYLYDHLKKSDFSQKEYDYFSSLISHFYKRENDPKFLKEILKSK